MRYRCRGRDCSSTKGACGDFNYATLTGNFAFDLAQVVDPSPKFGLVRDAQYIDGEFQDEAGNIYIIIRKFELNRHSWWFLLQSNEGGRDAIYFDREAGQSTYRGGVNCEVVGEEVVFSPNTALVGPRKRKKTSVAMNGFEVGIDAKGLRWREEGLLDIKAERVGPGMQWFTPYPDGGAFYLSLGHKAEGTIKGRKVRGFLFFDQFYLPPGTAWTHDPFVREIELKWNTFGNWYEDGTVELAHISGGHGNWGFAFVNSSKEGVIHCTSNVEVMVTERDADGLYANRIESVIDAKESWVLRAYDGQTMPDYDRPDNPTNCGLEQRQGDLRKPVHWMAWVETCPKHGNKRRP